jgi:hypothetical protein
LVSGETGAVYSAVATLPDFDALDLLDRYEEPAAFREFGGEQPRAEPEAADLAEAAKGAGLTTNMLRKLSAEQPDAKAYLVHLSARGLMAFDDVAGALQWDRTRAWQAEARLRASGMVTLDSEGLTQVRKGKHPK